MKDTLGAIQQLVPGLSGRIATTHGGEYHAKCPFTDLGKCDSHDNAFMAWPHREDDNPTIWWCRKHSDHPASGDLIELVRWLAKPGQYISYHEACDWLEMEPEERNATVQYKVLNSGVNPANAPTQEWQTRAQNVAYQAIENLWNTEYGEAVLEYLRIDRRLPDSIIRGLRFGAIPEEQYDTAMSWGFPADKKNTKIRIPAGIVIPCIEQSTTTLWNLVIRRSNEDIEDDPSGNTDPYWAVKGSGNGLYLADTLKLGRPAIMVESYIDAATILAVIQDDEELRAMNIGVVATRTTTGARLVRWIRKLSGCIGILQAFDNDSGGEEGAAYWLDRLQDNQCIRWSPGRMDNSKDVNEAHVKGHDVAAWIKEGLRTLQGNAPQTHQNESEPVQIFPQYICVYPGCQSLLGPYQRLTSGLYCLSHLWEAPEIKDIGKYVVKYEHNTFIGQMLTFAGSYLAAPGFAQHFYCFACNKRPTEWDMYARLWCEDHRFLGCKHIGTAPISFSKIIDNSWDEEVEAQQHCHLCIQEDNLAADDHGRLWCAAHQPYIAWSLEQFFPWVIKEADRVLKEQEQAVESGQSCSHKNCTGFSELIDGLHIHWCMRHYASHDLLNDGIVLKWPKLWIPSDKGFSGGTIEAGQENWINAAKSLSDTFLKHAARHSWRVLRGDVENTPSVKFPCERRDTAGCKNPTNVSSALIDDRGAWCRHCKACAELLLMGEQSGWPLINGMGRWEKGQLILLQGEDEYTHCALYDPVHRSIQALKILREELRKEAVESTASF